MTAVVQRPPENFSKSKLQLPQQISHALDSIAKKPKNDLNNLATQSLLEKRLTDHSTDFSNLESKNFSDLEFKNISALCASQPPELKLNEDALKGLLNYAAPMVLQSQLLMVNRPWWAISNLAEKAKWALIIASSVTLIASSLTFAATAVPAAGAVAIVSAVALGIIAGVCLFEKIRSAGILPQGLQRVADAINASVVEFFALLGCSILYPAALFHSDPKPIPGDTRQPILLVHGYAHNSSGWAYTKARLEHAGLGPVYTINLGKPCTFGSIHDYSKMVQDKIADILKETGASKVSCVGHSMGGLVIGQAAADEEHPETGDHIQKIISLSTPWQGTKMGVVGIGACTKEMTASEDNEFLNSLNDRMAKFKGSIHCLRGASDVVVVPCKNAEIKSASTTQVYPNHGHLRPLWSDDVIDEVIGLLHLSV